MLDVEAVALEDLDEVGGVELQGEDLVQAVQRLQLEETRDDRGVGT